MSVLVGNDADGAKLSHYLGALLENEVLTLSLLLLLEKWWISLDENGKTV